MNQIIHGDSYEILPTLPDKSFDTVIIDPPYGMGIDTWDKPVDVAFFTEQIKRIGREFYAVFGQMPYLDDWHDEAKRLGLRFVEDISWVKRLPTLGGNYKNLRRSHEHIYIYAIGKNTSFYNVKGRYEDIAIPNLCHEIISLEAIDRVLKDLRLKIKRGYGATCKKGSKDVGHIAHLASRKGYLKDSEVSSEFRNYTNVWSFLKPSHKVRNGQHVHPTEKPELLISRLVEILTQPNMSILDCFSGSGVVAIACKRLNRRFLTIEKQQDFYEYSLERLKGDVFQPELNLHEN